MWRSIACVAIAFGTASADPNPEAEKLFRDGRKLLADGKPVEACDAFGASANLEPSVGTFLNLGDCRAKLGQTASAWAAFVAAGRLARKVADPRMAEADRRSAELEPTLSYLTINVTPVPQLAIERDNVATDPTVWGQSVPVDPGRIAISAHAPGYDPWSTTIDIAPNGERRIVTVPALHPQPVAVHTQFVERSVLTKTRDVAIGVASAGALALVASGILALDANSLENDARRTCPATNPCHDPGAAQQSKTAVTRGTVATVVGGVGLAAVAAGVALWFVGRPKDSATPLAHVVPAATPDSVSLSYVGSF
jgi:hypothetical protein